MRMIDIEQESNQRAHIESEQNKDYSDDCEQNADEDAADKDMINDDTDSNILKRMPDTQTQVYCK